MYGPYVCTYQISGFSDMGNMVSSYIGAYIMTWNLHKFSQTNKMRRFEIAVLSSEKQVDRLFIT
jgi:hypothetical protein